MSTQHKVGQSKNTSISVCEPDQSSWNHIGPDHDYRAPNSVHYERRIQQTTHFYKSYSDIPYSYPLHTSFTVIHSHLMKMAAVAENTVDTTYTPNTPNAPKSAPSTFVPSIVPSCTHSISPSVHPRNSKVQIGSMSDSFVLIQVNNQNADNHNMQDIERQILYHQTQLTQSVLSNGSISIEGSVHGKSVDGWSEISCPMSHRSSASLINVSKGKSVCTVYSHYDYTPSIRWTKRLTISTDSTL